MKKPKKRYQVWVSSGNGNYSLIEFDSIEEALTAAKYTDDWYLSEAINDVYVCPRFVEPENVKLQGKTNNDLP